MKVVTFGDLLLRLNPPLYERFLQTDVFRACYTGAEANVAAALAQWGAESVFVSKVPAHELGQCAVNGIRKYGVDTRYIARGGERLGLFYLEKGASQRGSKIIYDRKNSAFAQASPEDFPWSEILRGAQWFHFSGITPALGGRLAEICKQACIAAKESGASISCDLNYRATLWSKEEARTVLSTLLHYADVCFSNAPQVGDVLGIAEKTERRTAEALMETYGCKEVFFTARKPLSASDNVVSAALYQSGGAWRSREYAVHIVDRVGAGDAFAAAAVYAVLSGFSPQRCIDFACAAFCMKHTVEGDIFLAGRQEIEALAKGDASGNIVR